MPLVTNIVIITTLSSVLKLSAEEPVTNNLTPCYSLVFNVPNPAVPRVTRQSWHHDDSVFIVCILTDTVQFTDAASPCRCSVFRTLDAAIVPVGSIHISTNWAWNTVMKVFQVITGWAVWKKES